MNKATILSAAQSDYRIGATIDTSRAVEWFNDFEEMVLELKTSTSPLKSASTEDYSITSNRQTITLPIDFRDMSKSGLGFFVINSETNAKSTNYPIPETSESAGDGFYWTSEDEVVIVGYSGTIRLFYIPSLTRATAYDGTETINIEERFRDFAVSYIRYRFFMEKDLQVFLQQEMVYLQDREAEFKKGLIKNQSSLRIPLITNIVNY